MNGGEFIFNFERDFHTFFDWIGNEKKQEMFNALVKEKKLSIEDLELIFQTVKPKTSGADSEIWRVKSVEHAQAVMVTVNKGNGTDENPILSTRQWWTEDGVFIGETGFKSNSFIIRGHKCGRDSDGVFHCECGKCEPK